MRSAKYSREPNLTLSHFDSRARRDRSIELVHKPIESMIIPKQSDTRKAISLFGNNIKTSVRCIGMTRFLMSSKRLNDQQKMKIRQLESQLSRAGFICLKARGKGSHRVWQHQQLRHKIIQSGHDGLDALPYQIKAVRAAIAQTHYRQK